MITSLKILDNIDYWGFRSNIKFFKNTVLTPLIINTFNPQTFSLSTSRLYDGQNIHRIGFLPAEWRTRAKRKKSSALLTSTEPNRSVSTFIIILIFFCRYINKPA